MKQPESALGSAPAGPPASVDAVRIEQLLDLQRDLLLPGPDPASLPGRLAQGAVLLLGVAGAAVGLLENGRYALLAAHGVPIDLDGRESALARAIASGRPLVTRGVNGWRMLDLPFRAPEVAGALHVLVAPDAPLPDEAVHLARVLTTLAGAALANARQHRRLRDLARLKSDTLTAMAHDLRAPLNALVGYANLLGEEAFGPLTREQREVAATLERQAIELVDLLGATLDVARLETGRLPVRAEEFAMADVLAALRHGTFAQASRSGRLACAVPPDLPTMRSDRVKVKEIVQNLVDNALKHGGDAAVEVQVVLAPDREAVRLTVRDGGPGIPDDVLPHLFEPFRAGNGGGTGFGLYIVRCFAEALGGRVAAHSTAGQGTAITVELPLSVPIR